MAYFTRSTSPMRIAAAFDVDPERVNRVLHGVHCHPMDALSSVIAETRAHVAILAVPEEVVQDVCDRLVQAGVSGILNFVPAHLNVPENVSVEDIDIAISLEKVSFFARSAREKKGVAAWPQTSPAS
jgi:redox-sensing transcriptional repressor